MNWQTPMDCNSGACVEIAYETPGACTGGTCVEVGYAKPDMCSSNANCVEVGAHNGHVLVRDTAGMVCTYTIDEWDAFTAAVKAGQYDGLCD